MTIVKPFKHGEYDLQFVIKGKDLWTFVAYSEFIEKLCKERRRVPARVFQKFISFLKASDDEMENYYKEEADKYVKPVLERYDKDKVYTFNVVREIKHEEVTIVTHKKIEKGNKKTEKVNTDISPDLFDEILKYSLEGMIRYAVQCVFEYELGKMNQKRSRKEKDNMKDDTIRAAYRGINRYIHNNFTSQENIAYKDSRRAIIAGYIAICFGYTLVDTKLHDISNELIFQATRNALKKEKPETK